MSEVPSSEIDRVQSPQDVEASLHALLEKIEPESREKLEVWVCQAAIRERVARTFFRRDQYRLPVRQDPYKSTVDQLARFFPLIKEKQDLQEYVFVMEGKNGWIVLGLCMWIGIVLAAKLKEKIYPEAEYFVGVLGVGGLIFLGHILYNKYKIKKFRLGKDEKITPAAQKIIGIFLKIAELLEQAEKNPEQQTLYYGRVDECIKELEQSLLLDTDQLLQYRATIAYRVPIVDDESPEGDEDTPDGTPQLPPKVMVLPELPRD